jgi:hypothetical protein
MTKQTRDKRAIRNCNTKEEQNNGKTDKGQKSIQRTNNTMTKQTRDKRAIRNCNSKDGEYNDKTDKGQKSNQKL